MKARSQELLEKSLAAMVSAIEVYNKPDFKYREETFSILAINAWELLLKAKWLKDNNNKIRSLYVTEKRVRRDGTPSKHSKVKMTASGNPFTHGLDYLARKMTETKVLAETAYNNLKALCEIRDSSVHFYNKSKLFAIRLQEVGSAAVINYSKASQSWFSADFSKYNFYLMPLAFVITQEPSQAVLLNKEEKNVEKLISILESTSDSSSDYRVSVNIELKFLKSKADDAVKVQVTNDPTAPKVQLTEEQLKDKYPLISSKLIQECSNRYTNFVKNQHFNNLIKKLKTDKNICYIRQLHPGNPKSVKTFWYSRAILNQLDKYYTIKC
ncbi:MAG: DUF3644 domain-containing protein [Anaerolineae bacterium]|nr:DUF3644 domain-containing protein [Anaerolineae bacterium]